MIKLFFLHDQKVETKKARQKFKYLENGKNFYDEIKSTFIFHHFLTAFIEGNKTKFFWKVRVTLLPNFVVFWGIYYNYGQTVELLFC